MCSLLLSVVRPAVLTLLPYTTLFRSETISPEKMGRAFSVLTLISSVTMPVGLLFSSPIAEKVGVNVWFFISGLCMILLTASVSRSEEHTSELQSRFDLVCRLLLGKEK